MIATHQGTVIGAFPDRRLAQEAVEELTMVGFRNDEIGVAAREDEPALGVEGNTYVEEGTAAGIAAGAGVGGLWAVGIAVGMVPAIGPVIAGGMLASVLASATVGAAAGGLAGALIGAGVPREDAHYYEKQLKAGRTIVTVKADGRLDEVVTILRRNGAFDAEHRIQDAAHRDAVGRVTE